MILLTTTYPVPYLACRAHLPTPPRSSTQQRGSNKQATQCLGQGIRFLPAYAVLPNNKVAPP